MISWLMLLCAVAAGGIGLFSLWNWWGPGTASTVINGQSIPMAPSTALLIIICAVAFGALRSWPQRRSTQTFTLAALIFTTAIAALVLLQGFLARDLGWEKWLVSSPGTMGEISIGRMSPLTAGVFILTVLSLLVSHPMSAHWPVLRRVGRVAAVLATGFCGVVVIAYAAGAPLFYQSGLVPIAQSTGLALGALNLAISLANGTHQAISAFFAGERDAHEISPRSTQKKGIFITVTTALLILVAAIGALFLSSEQAEKRRQLASELTAIAVFKTKQLTDWREEELRDARILMHAPYLARSLTVLSANPQDLPAQTELRGWVQQLKTSQEYSAVAVFDRRMQLLLAEPDSPEPIGAESRASLAAATREGEAVMADFYLDPAGSIHLEVVAPIYSGNSVVPVGAILLRHDPAAFLYPLLQSWPLPSQTGETLLVRQEGREVVYVNALRHQDGTALTLRRSIDDAWVPTARIVRGERGLIEDGVDYRGRPVVEVGRPVPHTPWFLMAKMDQAEALAPLRDQALFAIVTTLGLMIGIALSASLLWRQHRLDFLRQQVAADKAREALAGRLALVMQEANDIILVLDEDGRIVEANDQALAAYGYTLDELRNLPPGALRPSANRASAQHDLQLLDAPAGGRFETVHQRKDGTSFPVEISGRAFTSENRRYRLGIFRDISARKAHEAQIERLNRLYAALSRINQTIATKKTRDEMLEGVCRVIVEVGCFKLAWVGWHDPATRAVLKVAAFGEEMSYLDQVKVYADDRPEGRGPMGTAIREECTCVSNDYQVDARLDPWRNVAGLHVIRASISLPVRQAGAVVGALTVYAAEKNVFGADEITLMEEAVSALSLALDTLASEAQRLQAEAALRASERKFRGILESVSLVGVIVDQDSRITLCNNHLLALTGWKRDEVLHQNWFDLFLPPDVREQIKQAVSRDVVAAGNLPAHYQNEIITRQGERRLIAWNNTILRQEDGSVSGVAAIGEDITDRIRAEAALRQSEQEFRSLAEAMPQIVWVTRADGWNVYFNKQWTEYTGLTLEESYGNGWNTPFHPDDRQRAWDAWQNATHHGAPYVLECRLRRADGVYRWWLIRGVPLRDASGNILKWFGTCTDVEDIKTTALRLQQQAAELRERNEAMNRFNAAAVGRELRMIELKREINELCHQLGRPARFQIRQPESLTSATANEKAP